MHHSALLVPAKSFVTIMSQTALGHQLRLGLCVQEQDRSAEQVLL